MHAFRVVTHHSTSRVEELEVVLLLAGDWSWYPPDPVDLRFRCRLEWHVGVLVLNGCVVSGHWDGHVQE